MKNKLFSFAALSFLLIAFVLAVAPVVRAGGVDDKIQALESELSRLKSEQMELKKDAVAAAAAMPTFTYRPGSGATIEAADKAFSVNFSYDLYYHIYNATNGSAARGSTVGDLFLRHNRPRFEFCINNCFYDWGIYLKLDTTDQVTEQNQWLDIHFEQINPWFPTFTIGDADSPVTFPYVTRSSRSSAQVELASDMLSDSLADELSRKTIALFWSDRPIPGNLLPGVFTFDVEFKSGAGINKNKVSDTNHKQLQGTFGLKPFVRSKNPWLEKIKWGIALQADSVDHRSKVQGKRLRIRTMERGTNQLTLLDQQAPTAGPLASTVGGDHRRIETGLEWGYGPYLFRAEGGVTNLDGQVKILATGVRSRAHSHGGYWRIGHEVFIWSPKGLLTGSASTPHSLQLGWAFERSQADCGVQLVGCATGIVGAGTPAPGNNDFNKNRLINRELDLWYFITPAIRTGIWWWWYDSANTPQATQVQIGCSKNVNAGLGKRGGKDCSWHTVNLGLQASF